MDTDPQLEGLFGQLGEFGKYQFRQHLFHLLSSYLAGVHMLSLTLVAPTPPHRCFIHEIDHADSLTGGPNFNPNVTSLYFPIKDKETGELDQCHKFTNPGFGESGGIEGCGGNFVYDNTYYNTSRVLEWDLVCDNRWERAVLQSVYMFGVLVGAIVLGSLGDKYGRKKIFYISGILQLVMGLVSAFVPSYIAYTICQFFYGMFGSGGAYVTGFVLSMELVGPSKRTICGTMFSLSFAIGVMTDAIWGYFIRDTQILQCIFALHALSVIGHWWLIDESIRWLWGQGRKAEATAIVEKAVKLNGGSFIQPDLTKEKMANVVSSDEEEAEADRKLEDTPNGTDDVAPIKEVNNNRSYGVGDLFKTPRLRKRILCVAFNWFANSLVYYGLSLNTGGLPGNPFIVLFFVGFAELPGYFLVISLVDKTGRRAMASTLLAVGGIACITVAFIPRGTFVTVLVLIGKMGIAGSFAVAYNYSAELFPTVVRNSAIGVGACSARFSGMLTPLITLLDSIDLALPTITFGAVSVMAALITLLLPETVGVELPQTLVDGENFGRGDNGYKAMRRACCSGQDKRKRGKSGGEDEADLEQGQKLVTITPLNHNANSNNKH